MLTLLALLTLSLLTPLYLIYKPPRFLITYLAHRYPDVLWQVQLPLLPNGTQQKVVALSIDDAPSQYTREILAVLKKYGARATLFVIGNQVEEDGGEAEGVGGGLDEERMAMLRDAVEMGCELGNHAWRDEASKDLSGGELARQIGAVGYIIHEVYGRVNDERNSRGSGGGDTVRSTAVSTSSATATKATELDSSLKPPNLFRPGSGIFTAPLLRTVKALGYTTTLGSIYPWDAQIPYWRLNAWHVLSGLRPGAVVICHDRRGWTVDMLERVLRRGGEGGWRFVGVGELRALGVGGGGGSGGR